MTDYEKNEDGSVTFSSGIRFRVGFHYASMPIDNVDNPSGLKLFRRRYRNEGGILFVSKANELYHYTSLLGLQGIIKEEGFWASDSRFLNDAEEMLDGIKYAEAVLAHRASRTKEMAFRDVLLGVRDITRNLDKIKCYIVCFSTSRDSLEQWRGYGRSGAVAIRLSEGGGSSRFLFFAPDQMAFRVIYKPCAKVRLFLSIVKRFETEYLRDRLSMGEHWPEDHDEEYIKHLTQTIGYHTRLCKNEAFSHESEIRIIITAERVEKYGGLRFRPGVFGLIPFVSTGEREGFSGRLPIEEVLVGPSPHQEISALGLREFLDDRAYSSTKVTLSKVPYRSG